MFLFPQCLQCLGLWGHEWKIQVLTHQECEYPQCMLVGKGIAELLPIPREVLGCPQPFWGSECV